MSTRLTLKSIALLLILSCASLFSISTYAISNSKNSIRVSEINAAQKQWANGLLSIGQAYRAQKNYVAIARSLIMKLYAYNYGDGTVLFKPTKAKDYPFRSTVASALSYFTGNNSNYKEDKGFAIEPWKSIRFHNDKIYYHGDIATAMGEYYFTTLKNKTVKVEYTLGYVKTKSGVLKIFLQHSSLPFNG